MIIVIYFILLIQVLYKQLLSIKIKALKILIYKWIMLVRWFPQIIILLNLVLTLREVCFGHPWWFPQIIISKLGLEFEHGLLESSGLKCVFAYSKWFP